MSERSSDIVSRDLASSLGEGGPLSVPVPGSATSPQRVYDLAMGGEDESLQTAMTQRERELAAIIDAYNDVTERLKASHEQLGHEVRRLREELSRKNRQLRRRERLAALGELAAGVAHEIRNPLGGIRMFASLLRQDLTQQPESLRLVEKIVSGVSRLERIVTDILEFGRPAEPQPEPTVLGSLLSEVKELALGKRPGSQVQVDAAGCEELIIVTDGPLLQRALLNLVLNGIEAAQSTAGPAGCVQLRAGGAAPDTVCVEVVDNGPGIPAELMERVFNPFFTTKDTGTGLGLAIVHQTLELLGGSIQAGNRPEGGASFSITIPRVLRTNADEGQSQSKKDRPPRRAAAGTKTNARVRRSARAAAGVEKRTGVGAAA